MNAHASALGKLSKGIKKKISLAESIARKDRLAKARESRWKK